MEILPILCCIILYTSFIKTASVPGAGADPHEVTKSFNAEPAYIAHFNTIGDTVKITLEVETSGYVGFGFSPSGTMHGAELFIGGVAADGKSLYSGVYHSSGHTPRKFESHEWAVTSGTQNQTHTVLEIIRPLTASGHEIQAGDVTVIWAIGEDDDTTKHHAERGSTTVTIVPSDADNFVDVHGRNADSEINDSTTKTGRKRNGTKSIPRECCMWCDGEEDSILQEDSWFSFGRASSMNASMNVGMMCATIVFALSALYKL
jgi:hypothetical protein